MKNLYYFECKNCNMQKGSLEKQVFNFVKKIVILYYRCSKCKKITSHSTKFMGRP